MKIANLTKDRIIEYLEKGKRFDDRSSLEYRPIKVTYGISDKAEGSAGVTIGKTEVWAGVKLDVMEPYTGSEEEGTMMVTTELLPLASERFQLGPPSIQSIELARIVDRGIRESGFIDFKELCIKKGEKVWCVMIDIYPINDDGNLIDASALAAVCALRNAVFPKLKEDDKVDFGNHTDKPLPLTENMPLTLTFYKIGNTFILDPTTEEEDAANSRLTIEISHDKDKEYFINAMQKGGERALTKDEIFYLFDTAVKEREKYYKLLEEQINEASKHKKEK